MQTCKRAIFLLFLFFSLGITACKKDSFSGDTKPQKDISKDMIVMNDETFSVAQTRVVADMLSDMLKGQFPEIFNNPASLVKSFFSDNAISLADFEKEYTFYRELMMLLSFSQSYETWVMNGDWSDKHIKDVSKEAEEFYKKHGYANTENADGVTLKDCEEVFLRYAKATKYKESLKNKVNLIISDEDVRVVACEICLLETKTMAEDFIDNLKQGSNFSILAKETNKLDHTTFYLTRNSDSLPKTVIDAAFLLVTGEVCKEAIYVKDEGYYVISITDMFEEDMSKQNREKMVEEKTHAFYEEDCAAFLAKSKIYLNYENWESFLLFK